MSPSYIKERHHIGFLRADGTSVGLMLANDNNGKPYYRTILDKYLVSQYTTSPDGGATNPEEELHISQNDWRSGFGLYIQDSNDPYRYYESYGMDMRFKGQASQSYKPATITLPTITAVTAGNTDFETWSDANTPGTWTKNTAGGITIARNDANEHGGTYCASSSVAAAAEFKMLWQSVTWNNEYRSRTVTFTCYGKAPAANRARIAIYDGVGRTYSAYNTSAGSYDKLQVTRVLNAAATELTIELYHTDVGAGGTTVYWDDATFMPPTAGVVHRGVTFNGHEYIPWGNNLIKVHGTTGVVSYIYSFPATITSLEPFPDNNLYIALGLSEAYWYMSTSEVFTQSTAAENKFNIFRTVHTTAPTLYGSDTAYTVKSTTDPTNGGVAWSTATTVGSSYYDITELLQQSGALYIMKEDMPYYLDSTGNVQNDLAPELSTLVSGTSGKNSIVYKDHIYIPCGTQTLFDATDKEYTNPAKWTTNLTAFSGAISALAYDDEYLFAMVVNSGKIEVMCTREEVIDGVTKRVWHPYQELTMAWCEAAWTSNVYSRRIYVASIATIASGGTLSYIPLPAKYGSVPTDANRSFATDSSAYFTTPFYHGRFRNDIKSFIKITAELGHAYSASVYFTVSYKKSGDTNWTSIGNLVGTSASRKASLYIPVDASANKPVSTMMQFKFVGVTNSATTTPILLGYDIKAVVYPTVKTIIECAVRCADRIKDRVGMELEGEDAAYIRTVLQEARDATYPITFYDLFGNTKTVKVLPIEPFTAVSQLYENENPEETCFLRLLEVTIS
jgi:hypothetical protein